MAEVLNFTDPLSGTAVIEDVLGQIRKRLATDCNLRGTDGYSGGYSGTVTIKLKCHAVRISEVEMEIPITAPVVPALDSFPPEDVEEIEVREEIAIPLEPNLTAVRQRTTENSAENIENDAPAPEDEENLVAVAPHAKRKYTRRNALVGVGAEQSF